jgi:8-oxo-dGTP pyrophosphatase MutT (NUDIX family)
MPKTAPKSHQVAAVPIRRNSAGAVEVLLVTSRDTGRWVVPKGWPWPKKKDHEAAAGEAWEEAGVRGTARAKPIGTYSYGKRTEDAVAWLKVFVFLLDVEKEATRWPEANERQRNWFKPAVAAGLVDEPELKSLLRGLSRLPD